MLIPKVGAEVVFERVKSLAMAVLATVVVPNENPPETVDVATSGFVVSTLVLLVVVAAGDDDIPVKCEVNVGSEVLTNVDAVVANEVDSINPDLEVNGEATFVVGLVPNEKLGVLMTGGFSDCCGTVNVAVGDDPKIPDGTVDEVFDRAAADVVDKVGVLV